MLGRYYFESVYVVKLIWKLSLAYYQIFSPAKHFVTKKNDWKTKPCFVETLNVANGKLPDFTFYTTYS